MLEDELLEVEECTFVGDLLPDLHYGSPGVCCE